MNKLCCILCLCMNKDWYTVHNSICGHALKYFNPFHCMLCSELSRLGNEVDIAEMNVLFSISSQLLKFAMSSSFFGRGAKPFLQQVCSKTRCNQFSLNFYCTVSPECCIYNYQNNRITITTTLKRTHVNPTKTHKKTMCDPATAKVQKHPPRRTP